MDLDTRLSKEAALEEWDRLVEEEKQIEREVLEETTELEISDFLDEKERDVYDETGKLTSQYEIGHNSTIMRRKDKHTAIDKKRNPKPKTIPAIPYIRNAKDVYVAMADIIKGKTEFGDYLFVKGAGVYEPKLKEFCNILESNGEQGGRMAEDYALRFIMNHGSSERERKESVKTKEKRKVDYRR